LSLAFGLAPVENRDRVIANPVDDIMLIHKGHLSMGFIGMQWLMQTLTDAGHPEAAYMIATQTARPSWGYMVSKGATTIWEKWDMDTQGPDMNGEALLILSGNLEAWFYQTLAVINYDPDQPGFKHIILKPELLGDLPSVKGSHKSMHGWIVSNWQREGDRLKMDVTIPANSTATLYVAAKDAAGVTESGKAVAQAEGVKYLRMQNNAAVYAIGSGTYLLQSTLPENIR
jgi:alpha-L-rhamnosidase